MWPLVSREHLVDKVKCAREHKVVIIESNVIGMTEIRNVFVVDFLYLFVGVYDLYGRILGEIMLFVNNIEAP